MNEFWAEVLIELLPTDKPILPGQKKIRHSQIAVSASDLLF